MAPALRRVVRTMPQIAVVQIDDTPQVKKTKVAAYARVSTEKEEQEDSFERQVEHYSIGCFLKYVIIIKYSI